MFRFSRLLIALLTAAPKSITAQLTSPADTSPFHRGQWAGQFGAGLTFASLGFLHFSTPTRAWLVDLRFDGGHSHSTAHVGDSLTDNSFDSHAAINARVGRRFYQARGTSLVVFQSVGPVGGYTHRCSGESVGAHYGSCGNGWRAGAFGELGASYLITPRFSVGGTAAVSFDYERTTAHDTRGGRFVNWAYGGSIQGLAFSATIYF